jgi:hypothetical protein
MTQVQTDESVYYKKYYKAGFGNEILINQFEKIEQLHFFLPYKLLREENDFVNSLYFKKIEEKRRIQETKYKKLQKLKN